MPHPLAVALAAVLTAAGPHPPSQHPNSYAELDAFLEQRLQAEHVPGAAWAVASSSGVEHFGARGEDGEGAEVTESTPFGWGSVAKPLTATAVMTLVEDGRVDLDAPVIEYLPDFRLAETADSDRITVRHLLDHTGGLPEGTGVTDVFDRRADPYGEAVADLADAEPAAAPGIAFEYESANYVVLGALVESVTGAPYDAYLREAVLDPLGMDGVIATPEAASDLPPGHAYAFARPVAVQARFDQTGPSYGYLAGDADDLARFATAHLNTGSPVLDAESAALMRTASASMSDTVDYGLGWKIDGRNDDLGTATVWHTGAAPGYTAALILLPDLDRALVLLMNAYGFFQDGALVGTALEAARVLGGGQAAPERAPDRLYPILLAVLTALLAATVAAAVLSALRIRRPGRGRAAAVLWCAGALALAYAAAIGLPSALGADLRTARLFAPDVGWLLTAIAAAAAALAVLSALTAVVRPRRAD